jgi:hypothetical protein
MDAFGKIFLGALWKTAHSPSCAFVVETRRPLILYMELCQRFVRLAQCHFASLTNILGRGTCASGDANRVNKLIQSFYAAILDVSDGMTVMHDAFGRCSISPKPDRGILIREGVKTAAPIPNNVGVDGFGMGLMLEAGGSSLEHSTRRRPLPS